VSENENSIFRKKDLLHEVSQTPHASTNVKKVHAPS
jgi:hypothetical protein